MAPPELDALVDLAERSRVDDWSLRGALCRYAQPEPIRAAAVLSLVRRWEAALHGYLPVLRRDGAGYMEVVAHADSVDSASASPPAPEDIDRRLVGLLLIGEKLDALGDVVAGWAVARQGDPRERIDEAVRDVAVDLDMLGVPEEEPIPRGMRGRG